METVVSQNFGVCWEKQLQGGRVSAWVGSGGRRPAWPPLAPPAVMPE